MECLQCNFCQYRKNGNEQEIHLLLTSRLPNAKVICGGSRGFRFDRLKFLDDGDYIIRYIRITKNELRFMPERNVVAIQDFVAERNAGSHTLNNLVARHIAKTANLMNCLEYDTAIVSIKQHCIIGFSPIEVADVSHYCSLPYREEAFVGKCISDYIKMNSPRFKCRMVDMYSSRSGYIAQIDEIIKKHTFYF